MPVEMRIVVLVDGMHTHGVLGALSRLVALDQAELILVYVQGSGPRAGLEVLRHSPGGPEIAPGRVREMAAAEEARGDDALAEAGRLAGPMAAAIKLARLEGEPGRVVCELAAGEHADLVAVRAGGKDQPPVGPKSLGPAARFIADHSPCPVLLLRDTG
jgi:nucleotide-binding universal stress UspA family protein